MQRVYLGGSYTGQSPQRVDAVFDFLDAGHEDQDCARPFVRNNMRDHGCDELIMKGIVP